MSELPLAYAFTVGMVAAVNPCGFPMLPAYLSYFIGTDDEAADAGGRVPRALMAGGAVSLGFLGVFLALGIPIRAGVTSIYAWMPWLTIAIGITLTGLGLAMFTGYRLKVPLPRLDKGGTSRRFGSMVLFGVSYAIASLSCTIGLFIGVVLGTAQTASAASGALTFLAYGLGMSLVLLVLSLAIGLARESMVRRMRAALQYVDRAAGVLLAIVGVYLVAYGIHARDPINARTSPVGAVERWSSGLAGQLNAGGVGLGVVLGALVLAGVLVGGVRYARARPGRTPDRRPDHETV
jgi:cytochrome c-type biogenesis protein